MSYYFNIFTSYKVEATEECSFLYNIIFENDQYADGISYTTVRATDDFLKQHNLHIIGTLIPYISANDCILFENLDKQELEDTLKIFASPSFCLAYISNTKMISLINEEKPVLYEDMISLLSNLIEYWEKGYFIYCEN